MCIVFWWAAHKICILTTEKEGKLPRVFKIEGGQVEPFWGEWQACSELTAHCIRIGRLGFKSLPILNLAGGLWPSPSQLVLVSGVGGEATERSVLRIKDWNWNPRHASSKDISKRLSCRFCCPLRLEVIYKWTFSGGSHNMQNAYFSYSFKMLWTPFAIHANTTFLFVRCLFNPVILKPIGTGIHVLEWQFLGIHQNSCH